MEIVFDEYDTRKVSVVIAVAAIVILVIGIYIKWWELSTVAGYIPEIILTGIIGVLV
jgi:hypothetical protein